MLKQIVQYGLQVKGASALEFIEVKSPYDNEPVANVAQADEAAVAQAVGVALSAFKSVMCNMPASRRSAILAKTAGLIKENQEDLAWTICLEGGKPLKDARVEVSRAQATFQIASEETLRLDGEQLAMDRQPGCEGKIGIVIRQPLGVVAAITPFNFPINLVAHKLAPAFAAGNTVVLKPSSSTPVSSFKLAKILEQAGLPEGALQIVPCRGTRGNALVQDPRLAMLTFTGSPEVGWRLRAQVQPGVRTILELGGNAGLIVHDDADLNAACRAAVAGGYTNAGQTCISVQRIYVQEKVYDEFLELFVGMVKALKTGNPLDETTSVGPLIDDAAVEKTRQWLEAAVSGGARLLTGGARLGNNIIEPAVLVDTQPDMLVICREVFGPVVSVMKYATIDDAIAAINDPHYGLQAGIFTGSLEIAFKAARRIDAGGVMVNDAPAFRADHMPYGGRKQSGMGLEGVKYALEEMTQPKFICLNLPGLD